MEGRSSIAKVFAVTADHPEKCYDFDIQGNLDKYVQCKEQINFSEAAFMVYNAAQIYGRKVDYLQQVLLEFNERSAATIAKAIAERQKELEEADDAEAAAAAKKDKKKVDSEKQREKEREKALKRAKRMQKVTNKIQFKPKPFTIGTPLQISLNIHEKRTELECEEDFDQLRMKNVFPRINVLQSNLQNNNTFYDNLGIVDKHCDNLDSLRDFRIFMDTIDEPIYTRPSATNQNDTLYEDDYNRSQKRANQKHSNIYLSADYIKENYGIEIKDNSDYLNMLKYSEEIERLNLRKLTIEQLSKLKVGTYLNNILHGNKQDEKIPEHDSGIDDMDAEIEPDNSICDNGVEPMDTSDIQMTDCSMNDTANHTTDNCTPETSLNSTEELNTTAGDQSTAVDGQLDSTAEQSTSTANETTMDVTSEQLDTTNEQLNTSVDTEHDSLIDPSNSVANTSLESSKLDESIEADRRRSLDDGLGGSVCNSPTTSDDLNAFEGFNSTELFNNILNELNASAVGEAANGNVDDPALAVVPAKVVQLESNIFQIPEKLLRRNRLFQLTEEFEVWMQARKRKPERPKPDPPRCGKLLKLSNGDMVRADPDSDCEEFCGFEGLEGAYRTAPVTIIEENVPAPAAIKERTCSSDSGLSEKVGGVQENGEVQTTQNGDAVPLQPNDSGFADDSCIGTNDSHVENEPGTSNELETTAVSTDGKVDESPNNTVEINESMQATDISGVNIDANSTQICNDTKSVITAMDSCFDEVDSQMLVDGVDFTEPFNDDGPNDTCLPETQTTNADSLSQSAEDQLETGKQTLCIKLPNCNNISFFTLFISIRFNR